MQQSLRMDKNREAAIVNALEKFCGTIKDPSHLEKLEKQIREEKESKFILDYNGMIMVLAAGKKYLDPKDDWDEVIYTYMERIREGIQLNASNMKSGIIQGFASYCSAVSNVSCYTGYFKKFQGSINNILFKRAEHFALNAQDHLCNMSMQIFDTINGLAGITRYLLAFKELPEAQPAIKACLKLLGDLTLEKSFNGVKVPCYHIPSENQFNEDDKTEYPNGAFNFSLSHGIAGPMMVLSTALLEGIEIEGQREAIRKMLFDICRFASVEESGRVNWMARVSFESYFDTKDSTIRSRASWCYGTPGIARSVYIASKALGDKEAEQLALQAMRGLCKMPIEDYLLDSPIICHGYAGVLAIMTAMYKETGERCFYNRMTEIVDIILGMYDPESFFGFKDIYKYWGKDIEAPRPIIKEDKICLLEGTSGILLSLLGYLNKNDTGWMRNMLIL